jgi:hypothetical protein
MPKHDITQLERNTQRIVQLLGKLANDNTWTELIKEYRRPGWTTPAEFRAILGHTEAVLGSLKVIELQRKALIESSTQVG